MNPESNSSNRSSFLSRLSTSHLWYIAVGTWLTFGLFLPFRSHNSEMPYLLFAATAVPVAAVVRRRWFRPWRFVAEEKLLVWEKWLSILSIAQLIIVVSPALVLWIFELTGNPIVLGLGPAFGLVIAVGWMWVFSVGVLGCCLLLQLVTDVWNIRWTCAAVLAHLPILVLIAVSG
jgi:hypothetical protein